jgi:hypothetical protein
MAIDERTQMLKGSETATLVQERLGVSRSTYFERYRLLLRTYAISPKTHVRRPNGRRAAARPATFRFRRDEVEAMLDYLAANAG